MIGSAPHRPSRAVRLAHERPSRRAIVLHRHHTPVRTVVIVEVRPRLVIKPHRPQPFEVVIPIMRALAVSVHHIRQCPVLQAPRRQVVHIGRQRLAPHARCRRPVLPVIPEAVPHRSVARCPRFRDRVLRRVMRQHNQPVVCVGALAQVRLPAADSSGRDRPPHRVVRIAHLLPRRVRHAAHRPQVCVRHLLAVSCFTRGSCKKFKTFVVFLAQVLVCYRVDVFYMCRV